MSDYGSLEDLQERLRYLRCAEEGRLVPVIGSGLSNTVLPDVSNMISWLREPLTLRGRQRFDSAVDAAVDATAAYQVAASIAGHQLGDAAVARVFRAAVLTACVDVSPDDRTETAKDVQLCQQLMLGGSWSIPKAYSDLAQYYSTLPGSLKGPIITTNFDPLLEDCVSRGGGWRRSGSCRLRGRSVPRATWEHDSRSNPSRAWLLDGLRSCEHGCAVNKTSRSPGRTPHGNTARLYGAGARIQWLGGRFHAKPCSTSAAGDPA